MINTSWLKTFCKLVDVRHFTQTSESLYMTQSGVSQHIKKLEQQLDTALLIRSGKSFTLTEAGIKLHHEGKILLNSMTELESSIKKDEPYSGPVKISSPGSVGLKLYPHLLSIQQQHPELFIDYSFAPNSDIEARITARKIDIGLITERSKHQDIISEKIALEPLVLITSSEIKAVNWQELSKLGFINHPDGAHHAQLLLSKNFAEFEHIEQFRHSGFSNQVSLILEPVSRGLGFTVLPIHATHAFTNQANIKVHKLEHSVSEPLYLCHNRYSFETKRISYIKSVITDFIANF
ncbi:LysR family transcriptional regulator [Paraglaciecola marina]|uniref:LysR family transcriptional regulator n=1 Tax=Paraglaciecola marina TaxID=2500157 RepID=UPI00105F9E95|nr:LysR family transcriptional regulator [Paraglaciecola marina]